MPDSKDHGKTSSEGKENEPEYAPEDEWLKMSTDSKVGSEIFHAPAAPEKFKLLEEGANETNDAKTKHKESKKIKSSSSQVACKGNCSKHHKSKDGKSKSASSRAPTKSSTSVSPEKAKKEMSASSSVKTSKSSKVSCISVVDKSFSSLSVPVKGQDDAKKSNDKYLVSKPYGNASLSYTIISEHTKTVISIENIETGRSEMAKVIESTLKVSCEANNQSSQQQQQQAKVKNNRDSDNSSDSERKKNNASKTSDSTPKSSKGKKSGSKSGHHHSSQSKKSKSSRSLTSSDSKSVISCATGKKSDSKSHSKGGKSSVSTSKSSSSSSSTDGK